MLDEIPILSLVSDTCLLELVRITPLTDLALGGEEHPVRGDQEEQEQ